MKLLALPTVAAFTLTSTTTRQSFRSFSSHTASNNMDWSPLAPARLSVEPEALVNGVPQLAKDIDYSQAIQKAWKSELRSDAESESTPYTYQDANGATCYGHLIRRKGKVDESSKGEEVKVPGILFFHTGAGPHDVCLHWKADSLVTNREVFPDGCIVLIADILSDDIGWSWSSDRTKYNAAREEVLTVVDPTDGTRKNLQTKLNAALTELKSISAVDETRLAALGWCLGGHSVLELARMNPSGVKAMATFHGVFDGIPPTSDDSGEVKETGCNILLCNGAEDPFVSETSLQNAIDTMKQSGHAVNLLQLTGAKHGFTNPAQDFNPNESFVFNEEGADMAWSSTLDLLKSV